MSVPAAARRLARLVAGRRPAARTHRPRLAIQSLEDRAVPANSIIIVGHGIQNDLHISVSQPDVNGKVTISTTDGSALLSLSTIEAALTNPAVTNLVVTTAVATGGTDADEFGNIEWDATDPLTVNGEQLDFSGFGTEKTLTFRTAAGTAPDTVAVGSINLTAVHFLNNGTSDQINLAFDASAPDGSVSFFADDTQGTVIYSAEAVNDLTVTAGPKNGMFEFHDNGATIGAADAGGAVAISAGEVDISRQGGLTAGAGMQVQATGSTTDDTPDGGKVLLDLGTGLLATGDLTVTGTVGVSADTGALTSETGALSVTAPAVSLSQMTLQAEGNLTVSGADTVSAAGGEFTSGTGALSVAGTDVTLDQTVLTAAGDLTVSGSNSVEITTPGLGQTDTSSGGDIRVTAPTVTLPSAEFWADGGRVTISGDDVTGAVSVYAKHGPLSISGTNSVTLTDTTADEVDGLSITGATITLNNSAMGLLGTGDVTVTGTDVALNNSELATNDGNLTLTGSNSVLLAPGILYATGNLTVAGPVTLGPGTSAVGTVAPGTVTFTGPVDAQTAGEPDLEVAGGTIAFKRSIGATKGLNQLDIRHGNTTVEGNTLNAATVILFDPVPGPFPDPNQTVPATLGIAGTVTGNITANATANPADGRGNLAPGGLNKPGTMTVLGNVILNGDFELDLAFPPGTQTDKLVVEENPSTPGAEGNITLGPNSRLGPLGLGEVPGAPVTVIDAVTPVAGTFSNGPAGVGLLIGTDYARIQTYTPDMVIEAMPGQGKLIKGADADGTLYTITLTGPGTLVHGKDLSGNRFLVVRDATAASRLAVTTTANGSDDVVTFGAGVLVNGALASMAAPKVNIGSQFRSTGPIAVASFRDFLDQTGPGIHLGGTALNKTSITARNIFDDVTVGATLTSLKVAQSLGAPLANPFATTLAVKAPAIGTITAKSAVADVTTPGKLASLVVGGDYAGKVTAASIGKFQALGGSAALTATGAPGVVGSVGSVLSSGPNGLTLDIHAAKVGPVSVAGSLLTNEGWNISGGVTSLTAGSLSAEITAGYLGPVLVKGNLATGLSGDIQGSTINVTSNSGPATGSYGIKSLTAKGTVRSSLFDVKSGNVGPVTVGRFIDSQLYLDYTPHDPGSQTFLTGGAFGAGAFKLTAFKTTAVPLGDANNPLNWAFANSEIAAEVLGAVTLSGVRTGNGGTAFGIKAKAAGAVKVLAADDPSVLLNVNLPFDSQLPYEAVAGDFYLLDV